MPEPTTNDAAGSSLPANEADTPVDNAVDQSFADWPPASPPRPYPQYRGRRRPVRAQPEYYDDSEYYEDEYDDRQDNAGCGPITVLAGMSVLLVVAVLTTVMVIRYLDSRAGGDSKPVPDRSLSQLVTELSTLYQTKEERGQALYLSKYCRGLAGGLEDNYKNTQSPIIDTSREALAVMGIAGEFAMVVKDSNGNNLNAKAGITDVLQRELEPVLGDLLKDGEVRQAELTPAQRQKFVEMWRRFADAFQEVSGG